MKAKAAVGAPWVVNKDGALCYAPAASPHCYETQAAPSVWTFSTTDPDAPARNISVDYFGITPCQ